VVALASGLSGRCGVVFQSSANSCTRSCSSRDTCPRGLYDEILKLCRAGGYVPSIIRHGIRMTAAMLAAEAAVTLAPERLLKRRGQGGTGELTWWPLEGDPVRTWTSAVCRRSAWDPLTQLAVTELLDALQTHERWVPSQRPAASRGRPRLAGAQ
jgi:hypothetical protein